VTNLVLLRETNLLDVPATLRKIADGIEAGDHGQVHAAVLVLDAAQVAVFYAGSGEAGPNGHLLLHAGAAKMVQAVLEAKG
jgi:hypothetical protein